MSGEREYGIVGTGWYGKRSEDGVGTETEALGTGYE